MVTLKQIEAFYVIGTQGSFVSAAATLGTTQSALSKRISEMELIMGVSLFDRSVPGMPLSGAGRSILRHCEDILRARSDMLSLVGLPLKYSGAFKLGITELVAQTFLPTLASRLQQEFPEMILEPEVNLSLNLYDKVESAKLTMAIVPGVPRIDLASERLGEVELACMCNPTRFVCPDDLSMAELSRLPLLMQTDRSALQATVDEHFRRNNVTPKATLACNSLSAISGLAVAGLGVGILPKRLYLDKLASG